MIIQSSKEQCLPNTNLELLPAMLQALNPFHTFMDVRNNETVFVHMLACTYPVGIHFLQKEITTNGVKILSNQLPSEYVCKGTPILLNPV